MSALRTTVLTPWHAAHGAKLVDFAGWSMPLQYEGVMAEHRAVRGAAGLFDVSHMAEFGVRGSGARASLDRLVTNNVGKLAVGEALYTALCREDGGVLDDLLVYCLADDDFLVVANASNHAKVRDWLARHLEGAELEDETEATGLLALQGPRSRDVLARWSALDPVRAQVEELDYYRAARLPLGSDRFLLSRTGYTGEWGYELYVPAPRCAQVWEELLDVGQELGLVPAGLGARDTLRLEAGYALYGHELSEEHTPYASGIGWVVKARKASDFIGKAAMLAQREAGVPHQSVALTLKGRAIARQDTPVFAEGREVGVVTSGSFSPTLEHGIALARVETAAAEKPLEVEIRGTRHPAKTVKSPFVPSRVRD